MKYGLRFRFVLAVAVLIILVADTLSGSLLYQFKESFSNFATDSQLNSERDLQEQMRQRGITQAQILAENIVNPLYDLDIEALWHQLNATLASPDILFATVYDSKGRVVHDGNEAIPSFGELIDDAESITAIQTEGSHVVHETKDMLVVSHSVWIGDTPLGGVRTGQSH